MLLQGKVNESIPTKVKDHYLQFVPVKIKYQDNLQGKVKPFFTDSIQMKKDTKVFFTSLMMKREWFDEYCHYFP